MSLNRRTSYGSIPNFIKIDWKICEKKSTEVSDFKTVILNEGQSHSHQYQTIHFRGVYHNTKLERNSWVNIQIKANVKGLLTKSSKLYSLPWILIGWYKMSVRLIRPTSLNSIPYSTQTYWQLWGTIGIQVFSFPAVLWPWIKVKDMHTWLSITTPHLNQTIS